MYGGKGKTSDDEADEGEFHDQLPLDAELGEVDTNGYAVRYITSCIFRSSETDPNVGQTITTSICGVRVKRIEKLHYPHK